MVTVVILETYFKYSKCYSTYNNDMITKCNLLNMEKDIRLVKYFQVRFHFKENFLYTECNV